MVFMVLCLGSGTAVAQWLRCCVKNRKVAGSFSAGVIGFFIDIKSFRSHYVPGVDSTSNINEYQEHFLRGKGCRCLRLTTLPPSCAVVMKSGNLNFLESSGPLWTCNGTTLPFKMSWKSTQVVVRKFHCSTYSKTMIVFQIFSLSSVLFVVTNKPL